MVEEILIGRKTFFIAPDFSLIPESYLEEYLELGYECYFVCNDKTLPVEYKVDVILSVFKDSIVFFCIDTVIHGVNWEKIIFRMQKKYGDKARLGVIYNKRKTDAERHALERRFLFDMGLQCGCIQLEYQKRNNFALIEKVLFANQARGRRMSVRAICDGDCNYTITTKHGRITGKVNDISMTHFSITLQENECDTKLYEKVCEIVLGVKGVFIRTDAVLYMSRPVKDGILNIFMFVDKMGHQGLDSRNQANLLPKLYSILHENCDNLLKKLFETTRRKLIEENKEEF